MKILFTLLFTTLILTTGCVVGDLQPPKEEKKKPPQITSLTPNGGPTSGGNIVTFTGSGFMSGMRISIGGKACNSVGVLSSTSATCRPPSGSLGPKNVVVTNTDGQSGSLSAGFNYRLAPAVTAISPLNGSTNGGDIITISGTGFVEGATVALGSTNCNSVTVSSSTTLTCITESNSISTVSAVVTNNDGQASSPGGAFNFLNPPNPTVLSTNAGFLNGGTALTISGTNFIGPVSVIFSFDENDFNCNSVNLTGSTQIDCLTPNTGILAKTTFDLTIINNDGVKKTLPNAFTFQPAPTVTSITPPGGSPAGGTRLTITGTQFDTTNGVSVQIGGSDTCAPDPLTLTETSFECVTSSLLGPLDTPLDVIVRNNDGNSQSDTLTAAYTYQNGPIITSVSADYGTFAAGKLAGGTNLSMSGANFLPGMTVTVGTKPCTIVTFPNSTNLTCTTSDNAASITNVIATNLDGQFDAFLSGFTYQPPPTVSYVDPDGGPRNGGQTVTIFGTGFDNLNGINQVQIGGLECNTFNNITSTSFDCTTVTPTTLPALGPVSVRVVNNDGDLQENAAPGIYRFQEAPSVNAISPNSGPLAGASSVTITGTNFRDDKPSSDTIVTIDGNPCTGVIVNSSGSLTCNLPAGSSGTKDVVVTNYDGQNSGTSGNGLYSYILPPSITSFSPTTGRLSGNFPVTIVGNNFYPASTVTINGAECSSPVVTSTQISCIAPSNPAGAQSLTVTNPDGQSETSATPLTYLGAPTITSTNPVGSPPAGGIPISIFGTNFDNINGLSVKFRSRPPLDFTENDCTSINVVSTGQIDCTLPANLAGNYDIKVINNDGGAQSVTLFDSFIYAVAPTVTSINPTGGSLAGGETLTVIGTGFISGATVTLNGANCTDATFINDTTLTCTIPSSPPLQATVVVRNPDTQTGTLSPGGYQYSPAPIFSSVNPSTGRLTGGSVISITGEFFQNDPGTTVSIGGEDCAIGSISAVSISCTTGAHTAGIKDIVITNSDGQSSTEGTGAFLYQAAPTVTGISPGTATTAGGTVVTIFGTGFDTTNGIFQITLNGINCSSPTIIDSTQATCTTGASSAGTGDIVLTNYDGDLQSGTSTSAFSYIAPPDVSGATISPANGPAGGGTTVTISGASGFIVSGTTNVSIGGASCTSINVTGPSSLTCVTGANTAGSYPFTVSNFDAQSGTRSATFTYDPAPNIVSINKVDSRLSGGSTLTITGNDFIDPSPSLPNITIGGSPCTSSAFTNTTTLTCVIPPGTAGLADIVVTNPDGQTSTLSGGAFQYRDEPSIDSLSPSVVDPAGGMVVTINGSGFINNGPITVTFDPAGTPTACSLVTYISSTQISCTSPALSAGTYTVRVTNGDDDTQQKDALNAINYLAPPNITGITPNNGPITGNTSITITGTNFVGTPLPTVTVDGNPCTSIIVTGTTQISCNTPAGTSGAKDVIVTTYNSLSSSTGASSLFTYNPPPTVTGVTPTVGDSSGATPITITGTGFISAPTSITVGGVACGTIGFNSATEVTCTTGGPGPTTGPSDIVVTNPDNLSGTGTDLFTYLEAPSVTAISPTEGPATGGTTVTITGSNFFSGVTVTIGGLNCTSVNFVDDSEINCQTPNFSETTTLLKDVIVTNPDGQSSPLPSSFSSEAVPTFTSITPNNGDLSGGTNVTIAGTGFESGLTVFFGGSGVAANSVTNSQIVATSPASASTGLVDIRIQNSNGQEVTSANAFTYNAAAAELDWQLGSVSPNPPDPDIFAPGSAVNESHTYTLKNVGSLTTGTISIFLSGANTSAFFIPAVGAGDNCTGNTLSPGQECTVQLVFLGGIQASGTYNAIFNATDSITSDSNTVQGIVP